MKFRLKDSVEELAASIAHEVSQPLSAVANNANACLNLLCDPAENVQQVRAALCKIIEDAKRACAVVGRVRQSVNKKPMHANNMHETNPIVFVIDDDLSVRRSMERLLRSAGFEVRCYSSAREFLKHLPPPRPACLIVDVRMPGGSGIELQHELTQMEIRTPVIFITGHGDIPTSVRAMKAGAVDFLTKPLRSRTLLESVRRAIDLDRAAHEAERQIDELRGYYQRLTPREREVLPLVAAGLLNKQVAAELATTERTIKFHRAHIMQKAHAGSLADLVRMVEKLGLETKVSADFVGGH
jgi:FixJ family two-component response regulator